MLRYVAGRLLLAIPTVVIVLSLTFFLVHLVPGSPANFILGQDATPEQIHAVDRQLGLDRPLATQYTSWFGKVLHGDLGTSYVSGQSVTTALSHALPATLSLALLALAVSLVLGVVLGMWAAVRGGGKVDSAVRSFAGVGLAVPPFWLAALLIWLFALELPLFPATGYVPLTQSPEDWILSLALPTATLAIGQLAQIYLQARFSVQEVLGRDFVRTLQAVGLPRHKILFKHVLRNAAIPVVSVAGTSFIFLLSGVVVVEAIFSTNGLGSLMLSSVQAHDLPVVQGIVLYFTALVLIVNTAVDLIVAWLDPRVRTR